MAEVLRLFGQYEAVLYFILGLGGILYLYRFWLAWQEGQTAVFGLERDESRSRLNRSAAALIILLVIAVAIFLMVTFIASSVPAQELLSTPTLDLSFTSSTLSAPTVDPANVATATPLATVEIDPAGCVPDRINITAPVSGDTISGAVTVEGTVDVPNFGFYKFEVARSQESLWLTIQAGRNIVREGVLVENWDTSRLPPGAYVLQLVVIDSEGEELPPCRIPVQIEMAEE
jgi:hypothetical protein